MHENPATSIDPIAFFDDSTVVAEYQPDPRESEDFQTEADLERELIESLQKQAYEYLPIHTEADLLQNLRTQLEKLNDYQFTDSEWQRFLTTSLLSQNDGIAEKTNRIQRDHIQALRRDDGSTKNIRLIDKDNIHNNRLQVINQYVTGARKAEGAHGPGATASANTGAGNVHTRRGRHNRYDVTLLVNGLPMIHMELKRRGVAIREAFNQIERYQRDSFWADSGLFEYVQIFIISNGTHTKYYSNTTRDQHVRRGAGRSRGDSDSFEFTSWWADAKNNPITDLIAFAKTFLAKHAILNILTKYCVYTSQGVLMVMRPYQIVATERILSRIHISTNYKKLGTLEAGGYIWHTTGSGKTLTSFKTAQLATQQTGVDKVLFVVDRKDLDYQTMREYDQFQKGAANSNTSTRVLQSQLEDPNARIIITTIQKLATFIRQNPSHPIYRQHVVLIFDECHRSQFGEMHTQITRHFRAYHLFGFTGTPIFALNAGSGPNPKLKTTAQAFGDKLHTYTIVDAITDKNVLPFRIDYINTMKQAGEDHKDVPAINTDSALLAPERISAVTRYILEHFDAKTLRAKSYQLGERRVRGFNALFATQSIDAAKRYYNEFARQQADLPPAQRLKVALIYSFAPNQGDDFGEGGSGLVLDGDGWAGTGLLGEENFSPDQLPAASREFLEDAIQDYNDMFGTSFDTSSVKFENYYKDLSKRLKERQVDLCIVVNMFLTGFDAKTMNTLFADKGLRAHGLIQAYSRTNRILNSVKTYGNIVSFRDLEAQTNEALQLFGNRDARGTVLLKPYADYKRDYDGLILELLDLFPLGQRIVGEAAKKDFVDLFGRILRLTNILRAFDEFEGQAGLTPRQEQDYRSVYLDIYEDIKGGGDDGEAPEDIHDDVTFEIELIKQVDINVDYILMLVDEYRQQHGDGEDRDIRSEIRSAVSGSPALRDKQDLIEQFLDTVNSDGQIDERWVEYVQRKYHEELDAVVTAERLKPQLAEEFMDRAFEAGVLRTTGTELTALLPAVSMFGGLRRRGAGGPADGGAGASAGGRAAVKARVIEKLQALFTRFENILPKR